MIELGHICYHKLANTKFGDVAREEISADIAKEVEKLVAANLARALGDILIRRIGLDLDAPTSEVSPGDTIVFPGGLEKSFPACNALSAESFAKELHVHTQAIVDDKSTEGVKGAVRWLSDVFLTVEPFYKHFGLIDDLETANSNLKSVLKDIQTVIDKAMADDDSLTLVDAIKVVLTPPEPTESAQGSTKELEEQVTSLLNTIRLMEERAGQDQAQIASYKETAQDLQEHLDLEQGRTKELQRSLTADQEQLAQLENAKALESIRVQQLETKVRDLTSENQILNAKCDGLWKEGQSQVNMLTSFILRMTGEETYSVDAFNRAMDLLGEAPEF